MTTPREFAILVVVWLTLCSVAWLVGCEERKREEPRALPEVKTPKKPLIHDWNPTDCGCRRCTGDGCPVPGQCECGTGCRCR